MPCLLTPCPPAGTGALPKEPHSRQGRGCPVASSWCQAGAGDHPCPCSHAGASRWDGMAGDTGWVPRPWCVPTAAASSAAGTRPALFSQEIRGRQRFNPFWPPARRGQSGLVGQRGHPAGTQPMGAPAPSSPAGRKEGRKGGNTGGCTEPCTPNPRPRSSLGSTGMGFGVLGRGDSKGAVGDTQSSPLPPTATPPHGKRDSSLQQKREAKPSASAPGRGSPRGFPPGNRRSSRPRELPVPRPQN